MTPQKNSVILTSEKLLHVYHDNFIQFHLFFFVCFFYFTDAFDLWVCV